MGVPQAKREHIFILIVASAINRNEETSQKKMFSKILSPVCELYVLLFEDVHFFSITCNENASGSLNCSEIGGTYKRVKLCVGGDWQWKFGGRSERGGRREKAHVKRH